MVIELIFLFASLLTYVISFIYRRLAMFSAIAILIAALNVDVNFIFVSIIVLVLTLIRLRKTGVKDEF